MTASQTIRPDFLSSPIAEKLNLGFPLLLLFIAALEAARGGPWFTHSGFARTFLVDVVFLNVTHNAFTFLMLLKIPELREWIFIRSGGRPLYFWAGIVGLIVILSSFFFLLFQAPPSYSSAKNTFLLLNLAFPMHHALSQSLGLSLCYNRKFSSRSPVEQSQIFRIEKAERSAYLLLVCGSIVLAAIFQLSYKWPADIGVGFASRKGVNFALLCLVWVSAIFIVFNSIRTPGPGRRGKFIFSLRVLLWPLATLSPFAFFSTMAVHGVEYAFVSEKLFRSRAGNWKLAATILIGSVVVLSVFRKFAFQGGGSPFLFGLASLSFAISFTHYFLDRMMFRMRNELNRRQLGKLLWA